MEQARYLCRVNFLKQSGVTQNTPTRRIHRKLRGKVLAFIIGVRKDLSCVCHLRMVRMDSPWTWGQYFVQ